MANDLNRVIVIDIVGMIQQAAAEGVAGTANGVQAVAAAFAAKAGNRSDMATAHQTIAERMQIATLDAYDAAEINGDRERESPNRFKGKLRPALEDSRMIQADARSISFVNIAIMRARARHYRRLNFGAKGIGFGGESSPVIPLSLFGSNVGRIGFNQDSRPAFALPPGLFLGGNGRYTYPDTSRRGTGVFVPLGELPGKTLKGRVAAAAKRGVFDQLTRGIQPRRFLEAGLVQFAEAMPQEYNTLVRSWLESGSKSGKAYLGSLKVRGGASRIRDFSAPSIRVRA